MRLFMMTLLAAVLCAPAFVFGVPLEVEQPPLVYDVPTTQDLSDAQAADQAARDDLEAELRALIVSIETAVADVTLDTDANTLSIDLLAGDIASNSAAVADLDTEISNLQANNSALTQALADLEARIAALEAGMPPPDPDPDNPYADMPENTWRMVGPRINSIWAEVDPPLDALTRGDGGLTATVRAFCGAGFAFPLFTQACGGHNDGGYGRAWRYNIEKLTVEWLTADIRLNDPRLPVSACPYPWEMGDWAGSGAHHTYDGMQMTPGGVTYIWGEVPYYCHANPREPDHIWKISRDGAWTNLGPIPKNIAGTSSALLPDGKILTLARNYRAVFDPATDGYVTAFGGYMGDIGDYANLMEAGETEDGKARFLLSDYGQDLWEILVSKRSDGAWQIENPRLLARDIMPWHTNGVEYLPDHDAIMTWGGGRSVKFILLDGAEPEARTASYDEIRDPDPKGYHIFDGGLQWVEQWGVVVALGPDPSDGLHIFKPPADIRAATDPSLPPPTDLQALVDNPPADGVIRLTDQRYGPAVITQPGLTIECALGVEISGMVKSQGSLVVEATPFTTRGCRLKNNQNKTESTGAIWLAVAGSMTVEDTVLEGYANCIVTSSYRHGPTDVTVRNSRFVNCGMEARSPGHGIYYGNGGNPDGDEPIMHEGTLLVENSRFEGWEDGGHFVKSGARVLRIEGSEFETGPGLSYRSIDPYAGGDVIVRNSSFIHNRPPADNDDVIGIGGESDTRGWPETSVEIDTVTAGCQGDVRTFARLMKSASGAPVTFVGATADDPDGNSTITGCGTLVERR